MMTANQLKPFGRLSRFIVQFLDGSDCSKYLTHLVAGTTCSSVLLGGCLVFACSSLTAAQNVPSVLNRLPAPPPIPSVNSSPRKDLAPIPIEVVPVSADPVAEIREDNFGSPQAEISPSSFSGFYRVEVQGEGDLLLTQVKRIEPLAFVRIGEGVIQAGLFQQQYQAEERVRQLETQGLSAQVVIVNYGASTSSDAPAGQRVRRYILEK